MPLLTLLIIASLVAAVAFFLAGLLLAPARPADEPARPEPRQPEAPSGEVEDLRRQLASAEKARESAREEIEHLGAKGKTLADRLRAAEDENRAAFGREENAAEAWAGQLETARAEHKRHDQTLEREVADLRDQLTREQAERERLAAQAGQSSSEAERLVAAERAWQAKVVALEEALQARLTQAEAERTELGEKFRRGQAERETERQAGEEETLSLSLRVRAAEEVAEQRKVEVLQVVESLRTAEARLRDLERLAQENAELREQQAHAEQETRRQAGRDDEVRDAKVELAAAQAKLADLERLLEDNRRLRDEVAELRTHQEASGELERLTVAHKQVRLDAELMARRLQELLHDQAELTPLRAQAADAASLAAEVEYLRRREKDLEAQLYASGSYASRELPVLSGEIPVVTPGSDLETSLNVLVGDGGPRTAVLADAQGFLIASAGESVTQEGLAAFAAVAGEMVARTRMLLPLAEVSSVRVTDANHMVLTCHLFDSAGEGLGVATLGPGEPKAEDTARAIAGVTAIVSGSVVTDGAAGEDEPGSAT